MRTRLVLAAALVAGLTACGDSPVAPTERAQVPAASHQLIQTDTTTVFLNHDPTGYQEVAADSTASESRGGGFIGGGT